MRLLTVTVATPSGTLLTGILALVFLLPCPAACDLFTSSHKINQMVNSQEEVLDVVSKFLEEENDSIEKLSNLYYRRSEEIYAEDQTEALHVKAKDTTPPVSDHPNRAYLAIKRFYRAWAPATNSFPRLKKLLEGKVPSFEDFSGALSALVRLQDVYELEARDMMAGNYLGHQGPPLEPEDPYELGRQAFQDKRYKLSIIWLEMAFELQKMNTSIDLSILSQTAALLGRAYLYNNNKKRAEQLFQYSYMLGVGDAEQKLGDQGELWHELRNGTQGPSSEDDAATDQERELCGRDKLHRLAKVEPYHVCRRRMAYRRSYWTFREEILSLQPFVSLIYDVISDKEIEAFTTYVRNHADLLNKAKVEGFDYRKTLKIRTAHLTWISDRQLDEARRVSDRIRAITDLELESRKHIDGATSSGEPFQVVNYGLGGHYSTHLDILTTFDESCPQSLRRAGNRIVTFLIYLNDVIKGGNTIFVNTGISVAPIKGMALLWYNYRPDFNEPDQLTKHSSCPVVIGQKWIANKWIWEYGNTFRWPCGQSPSDTQLDIERLLLERDKQAGHFAGHG